MERHESLPRFVTFLLLAGAALVAFGGCGAGGATAVPVGGAGTLAATSFGEIDWARQVLDLTNAEREARDIPPLLLDERASEAAYGHSWDMDLRGYFDHYDPDGNGPAERLTAQGVAFSYAGENIARGQQSPFEVVRAWMESPGHRENLLSPAWTHVGIGVHTGPDRGPWWTQEFFRP